MMNEMLTKRELEEYNQYRDTVRAQTPDFLDGDDVGLELDVRDAVDAELDEGVMYA